MLSPHCSESRGNHRWRCAQVFDLSGKGELDAAEFKKALPLMGEDVSDEKIEELFQLADKDGSGRIEFPEFMILMKGMNPKV